MLPLEKRSRLAGVLLTGGSSSRMGFDKASMMIDGERCAQRVATALLEAVATAVEVGPGTTNLPAIREEPQGGGPLVALCAGAEYLNRQGYQGPVLVVACDLPRITGSVLNTLATWLGEGSVVPVVSGKPQTLCARWSAQHLNVASALVSEGKRAMRALLDQPGLQLVEESSWPEDADLRAFSDVDTPTDLQAIGLVSTASGSISSGGSAFAGPPPDLRRLRLSTTTEEDKQ